jgi:trypsin
MQALLLAACAALALGEFIMFQHSTLTSPGSEKLASTPLHRGGGRIVGGTDASPGEFPHQIMLTRGVGGSLMCGGSLVAPSVVVTAGHCCDGQTASGLGVVVGAHKLYQDDPDQAAFAVKTVILHEDYNANTINNDICLLILDGEADFSSANIGAIALPTAGKEYPGGTDSL